MTLPGLPFYNLYLNLSRLVFNGFLSPQLSLVSGPGHVPMGEIPVALTSVWMQVSGQRERWLASFYLRLSHILF